MERIHQLIKTGVPAGKILAVTFTKKAAKEMTERVDSEEKPMISTLHSLAFHIIIEHKFLIGAVRLAGTVDCKDLLLKILNYTPLITGVSYDGLTLKYGLITTLLKNFEFIDKFGSDAFVHANPKKDIQGILTVKELYDSAFKENGYITFDEQISLASEFLKKYPEIQKKVQSKYDYIMIDEVQDLDAAQAEFILQLVKSPEHNIMICGDSDQSIYSFRGGSNLFMLNFSEIYPNAVDVWLEDNYRSSTEIVNLSTSFIKNNQNRIPMELKANFSTGFPAMIIEDFNEKRFYGLILELIKKGYQYKDIAVIATTNKVLLKLVETTNALAATSGELIPFEKPKLFLRDDYIFQTVVDLLELKIYGINQDAALYRILRGMDCKFDKLDRTLSLYQDHVQRKLIYSFESEEAGRYLIGEKEPLLAAYAKIYYALQVLEQPLKTALKRLENSIFPKHLCSKEVFEKINDIVLEQQIKEKGELYERLAAIQKFSDDTRVQYATGDDNQVHMLTAHDAKGKEFPVVILYFVDEFEKENQEEDRRLLYVALTRAKKVVFITESYKGKSQFLKEFDKNLITVR